MKQQFLDYFAIHPYIFIISLKEILMKKLSIYKADKLKAYYKIYGITDFVGT